MTVLLNAETTKRSALRKAQKYELGCSARVLRRESRRGLLSTIFPGGGSDITGSLVALAVHADLYENWTDVSGFLIADPRIVKNPKSIETITYKELRELSYMGASVLHEDAIFPVRKAGIPINIRNTNAPGRQRHSHCREHMPTAEIHDHRNRGDRRFCLDHDRKGDDELRDRFLCRKVLQVFEDNGISIEHMPRQASTHDDNLCE